MNSQSSMQEGSASFRNLLNVCDESTNQDSVNDKSNQRFNDSWCNLELEYRVPSAASLLDDLDGSANSKKKKAAARANSMKRFARLMNSSDSANFDFDEKDKYDTEMELKKNNEDAKVTTTPRTKKIPFRRKTRNQVTSTSASAAPKLKRSTSIESLMQQRFRRGKQQQQQQQNSSFGGLKKLKKAQSAESLMPSTASKIIGADISNDKSNKPFFGPSSNPVADLLKLGGGRRRATQGISTESSLLDSLPHTPSTPRNNSEHKQLNKSKSASTLFGGSRIRRSRDRTSSAESLLLGSLPHTQTTPKGATKSIKRAGNKSAAVPPKSPLTTLFGSSLSKLFKAGLAEHEMKQPTAVPKAPSLENSTTSMPLVVA